MSYCIVRNFTAPASTASTGYQFYHGCGRVKGADLFRQQKFGLPTTYHYDQPRWLFRPVGPTESDAMFWVMPYGSLLDVLTPATLHEQHKIQFVSWLRHTVHDIKRNIRKQKTLPRVAIASEVEPAGRLDSMTSQQYLTQIVHVCNLNVRLFHVPIDSFRNAFTDAELNLVKHTVDWSVTSDINEPLQYRPMLVAAFNKLSALLTGDWSQHLHGQNDGAERSVGCSIVQTLVVQEHGTRPSMPNDMLTDS